MLRVRARAGGAAGRRAEIWASLLHYPAVPTREFGLVLFMSFGEFLHLLGGSLFQVGLPLGFGFVLLLKNRDAFAVHHASALIMGAALAWAGYIVWRQFHARKL